MFRLKPSLGGRRSKRDELAETRASRARILSAATAERRRLERLLQRGAEQDLIVLNLRLGLLRDRYRDDNQLANALEELGDELLETCANLRQLAHEIYPSTLDSAGLPDALHEATVRAVVPTTLECERIGRFPAEVEAAVYFCSVEALANVARHAGRHATARVELQANGSTLHLTVNDDGLGFDAAAIPPGAGIQKMIDRIAACGGELRIESTPGAGTTLSATIPTRGEGPTGRY
jgi:signal transduction histidine kinase